MCCGYSHPTDEHAEPQERLNDLSKVTLEVICPGCKLRQSASRGCFLNLCAMLASYHYYLVSFLLFLSLNMQ